LDEAETEARDLAKRNPGDLEVQFQLASVLAWNKKLDEAAVIFEQLQKANALDARLPRKLAEVALWAGHYGKALERYHDLLARDWRQPDLWAGYVDAASGAKKLPEDPHKKMVLRLYEAVVANTPGDAVFLSRFGWVMRRLDEPKKGVTLLKYALTLNPRDRETRRLLAEALQDMGNYDEAEQHFQLLLRNPGRRP
jgi:tetratricopeptide (TPR) repeat protein